MPNERLMREVIEISKMIKSTPQTEEKEIREYHSKIIERLDSGVIITVPSLEHRNFHQEMWLYAFMIYNDYQNYQTAFLHFFSEEGKDNKGEFGSQRMRFNTWYDKNYIRSHLDELKNRYEWAKNVDEAIEQEVDDVFHKSIDDVAVEI